MIGSLNKSYDCASIIDAERLQHLSEFIKDNFDEVGYEIRTVDGASFKIDTLEEILSYSNPQLRRIVKLSIWRLTAWFVGIWAKLKYRIAAL